MANVLHLLGKYQRYLIGLALVLIGILCLLIRLNPLSHLQTLGGGDPLNLSSSDDPLYNFRQVELIIRHFPAYPWFEPMSLYPVGQIIYWGPVFPTIAALVCMALGMTGRTDIIFISQLIPPAMAAAMIPLMYLIGRRMADWRTGLIAAFFLAIIPGQYLQRSIFGYFDHHIAEVLFSTLFSLGYISILVYAKRNPVDLQKTDSLKIPAVLSLLTAGAYLLGLFTMPTMILFALIVTAFTVVQHLWDFFRGRSSDYLLLANTIIFGCAILGLLAFGLKHPGLDLSRYTLGHIYAYLMIIVGTGILAGLARFMKDRPWYQYPLALGAIGLLVAIFLVGIVPDIYNVLIAGLANFFGQQPVTNTVQEARAWDPLLAWVTFQYGLILTALGMAAVIYRNWREEHPDQIFVLVWSLIILYSTWQHIRYEYYLAVNIALLSAIGLGLALERGWDPASGLILRRLRPAEGAEEKVKARDEKQARREAKKAKQRGAREKKPRRTGASPWVLVLGAVVVLSLLFAWTSLQYDLAYSQGAIMNGDWRESLEWMRNHTPDPGVDYYGIFDMAGFRYPPGAYGVMSWWDYGHQITFIAQRIPNANPFQAGVAGPTGAAAYFMTGSEDYANSVADQIGIRYVITDIEMDSPKFWAMATWFNSSVSDGPYNPAYYVPTGDSGKYQLIKLNNQSYYETMISRLHNFDGSMAVPSRVNYIEYQLPGLTGLPEPLITNAQLMTSRDALDNVSRFNENPVAGNLANAISQAVFLPVDTVPALRHYRLVHESPSGVFPDTSAGAPDLKYVKVFEYVKGARIRGQGTIALDLVTNTGRRFTYRQASRDGEFIVPYPTRGGPYEVQALGTYRIEGTGLSYDVPESAVMEGSAV
jgi:dolichyl-diphosphooligosaccharide--protein glycosyltransferase